MKKQAQKQEQKQEQKLELEQAQKQEQKLELEQELEKLPTKSAKIRLLAAKGFTRAQIAEKLNIRYQHVRNVLITPIKKPKA